MMVMCVCGVVMMFPSVNDDYALVGFLYTICV